jgi:oligopeptide transport system permease protein
MIRLAPGGPFSKDRSVPPEVLVNLERAYHLDESLGQQFLRYLGGVVQGDFGPSFKYKDFTAVMGVAMTGIAVPNFVVAPVLTLILGLWLRWIPVGGWRGPELDYWLAPIIALCLPQIAFIARLTRGSMIEVLRANYVRTARAKGLPARIIITRHAVKAALLPVVSYLGPAIAGIITGSIVVEQIFGIPGIGRYFIQASLNRDYTLVMGVTIFYGTLIILLNLVADLLYGVLDPKVRYD